MSSALERYAANALELALMRQGYEIHREVIPMSIGSPRVDLVARSPEKNGILAIEIKAFNRGVRPSAEKMRMQQIPLAGQLVDVHFVLVQIPTKRIFVGKTLASLLKIADPIFRVLPDGS